VTPTHVGQLVESSKSLSFDSGAISSVYMEIPSPPLALLVTLFSKQRGPLCHVVAGLALPWLAEEEKRAGQQRREDDMHPR
jgi:hypothetical protein